MWGCKEAPMEGFREMIWAIGRRVWVMNDNYLVWVPLVRVRGGMNKLVTCDDVYSASIHVEGLRVTQWLVHVSG